MSWVKCAVVLSEHEYEDQWCAIENVTNSARLPAICSKFGEVSQVKIVCDTQRSPKLDFLSSLKARNHLRLHLIENTIHVTSFSSNVASIHRVVVKNTEIITNGELVSPECKQNVEIEDLNNEELAHIFSYFSLWDLLQVGQVCVRWRGIVKSVCAVKKSLYLYDMVHNGVDPVFSDSFLQNCLGGHHNLRSLEIHRSYLLGKQAFEIIGDSCQHLQDLKISSSRITDRGLWRIAGNCLKLKRAEFNECWRLSESGFQWLLNYCKDLEHLAVVKNNVMRGMFLTEIYPRMKTLVLNACSEMSEFASISDSFPNLKSLTLNSLPHFGNDDLKDICQKCPKIEYLEVSNSDFTNQINSLGYDHIKTLENLNSLIIEHVDVVGMDCVLVAVSNRCCNISTLVVSNCENVTDYGVKSLAGLPNLKNLTVSEMNKITSGCLISIAENADLVSLSLTECPNVDDSGPIAIVSRCVGLVKLNVSFIPQITTEMVFGCYEALRKLGKAKTLNINVKGCSVSTEKLITHFGDSRVDKFIYFTESCDDGRWDAIEWLWGECTSTQCQSNGYNCVEYEYWCQQNGQSINPLPSVYNCE